MKVTIYTTLLLIDFPRIGLSLEIGNFAQIWQARANEPQ